MDKLAPGISLNPQLKTLYKDRMETVFMWRAKEDSTPPFWLKEHNKPVFAITVSFKAAKKLLQFPAL